MYPTIHSKRKKAMKSLREIITLDKIIGWPLRTKVIALVVIFFGLLLLAYFFDVQPTLSNLAKLQKQESGLRDQCSINRKRLLRAKAYKQHAANLNKRFELLALKLPKEVQMSVLLKSISGIGKDSGLQFKLFDPLKAETKAKYVILPINIAVLGSYHQVANFINRISRLDRLITFESFAIKTIPIGGKSTESLEENQLNMSLLLFVYYQHAQVKKKEGGM